MHAYIEIESALAQIKDVRAFVHSVCQDAGVADEDIIRLELATTEVVSNIVRHAYSERPDARIEVEIETDIGCLSIQCNHWGESFDPRQVDPPSFDGSRDHGFGIYIVRQCVDKLEYGCDDDGKNYVRLTKECSIRPSEIIQGESQVG